MPHALTRPHTPSHATSSLTCTTRHLPSPTFLSAFNTISASIRYSCTFDSHDTTLSHIPYPPSPLFAPLLLHPVHRHFTVSLLHQTFSLHLPFCKLIFYLFILAVASEYFLFLFELYLYHVFFLYI